MKCVRLGIATLSLIALGAFIYYRAHESGQARSSIPQSSIDGLAPGFDELASAAPVVAPPCLLLDDEFDTLLSLDEIAPSEDRGAHDDAESEIELASYEEPAVDVAVTDAGSGDEKYRLEYKFEKGETIRWEVEHRAQVRTTVQGITQTADTLSNSIKVWKVVDVDSDGRAKLVYSVESVDMRQHFEGRQDVRYNSLTDAVPPPGFEDVAKSVGVDLSMIRLDRMGNVVEREERRPDKAGTAPPQEIITPPLPAEEVATGARWQIPSDIKITLQGGEVKRIAARQKFTLEEVSQGVAAIRIETVILTPVHDPAIEAQLVQSKANGVFRFDIERGRVVSQQSDIDERVVGFQGEGSAMHYTTRFVETLLPAVAKTARRTPPGPRAP